MVTHLQAVLESFDFDVILMKTMSWAEAFQFGPQ